jgi:tetratricopeptide (TPR) repeat protein
MKKIALLFVLTLFIVTVIMPSIGCQQSLATPASSLTSTPLSKTPIPATAKECYEQGIDLKGKQSAQALLLFSEAVKLDPGFTDAYYEKSKLLAQSNDWDGVISNSSKAISLNPNISEAYYLRGLAQTMKKHYDAAIIDLNMAANMETSKNEMTELKKVTNLIIPPGELILLHMDLSCGGGRDCRGNYMPYNNTLQLQLLVNPGDSAVEVNKIYISPPIEGRGELTSPIRYFDSLGLQYLVTCLSSANPPPSVPTVSIGFKSKNNLVFKKSNEISTAEITMEPGDLICPTN